MISVHSTVINHCPAVRGEIGMFKFCIRQEAYVLGVVSKRRGQEVRSAGWYGASEKKTRPNCPMALQWGILRPWLFPAHRNGEPSQA